MGDERARILRMLEDGVIDADEASQLIGALGAGGEFPVAENAASVSSTTMVSDAEPVHAPSPIEDRPDLSRLRELWKIPFFIASGLLTLTGLGLGSIYAATGGRLTVGFVCLWSVFIFAMLAAVLAFWSRTARWLHVRVQEKGSRRIAISLPVPLRLAGLGIGIARRYVDAETAGQLDLAESFLDAFGEEMSAPDAEPLLIEVDDDEDQVQVYLG